MKQLCRLALALLLLAVNSAAAVERIVAVRDDASLRTAVKSARPGTHILIAPGRYRPGVWVENTQGTANEPIIIEGGNPQHPPLFQGGSEACHFAGCSYLTLRNLAIQGQTENGLNLDDGGKYDKPAHHIVLEKIQVSDIGPRGNHDAIKLSGVDDFVVHDCQVDGWGGQSVDMVGCHRGLIEGCRFLGKPECSQETGPQCKGGSSQITIRRCLFRNGGLRAVNLGGSTGLKFFRPQGALYEAKDLCVEGCAFVGSVAPIAFAGVDGAVVRYNTIYHPSKWVMRILQETIEPGFVPCRNGRFEHNLIVFRRAEVQVLVNVGPHTQPESFSFSQNLWYCEDRPASSKPPLPTPETGGLYGINPQLIAPEQNLFKPQAPQAVVFGALAWKP
jgi:hypothetical protein